MGLPQRRPGHDLPVHDSGRSVEPRAASVQLPAMCEICSPAPAVRRSCREDRLRPKVLSLAVLTISLAIGSTWPASLAWPQDLTGKVFLILPDFHTARFEKFDRPAFVKAMKELAPSVEVKVLNSENNVQRQMSQVQAAITEGAKAIVLSAVDPKQAAGILNLAKQAGVPVICHGHACDDGPAYAYIAAPYVEVGQKQARAAAEVIETMFARTAKPVRLAKIYGDPKWPLP